MHHCRRDSQFPNKLLACVVGVVVHINDVLHVLGFDLSNVGIPIVVDVGLIHGKLAGPSVDGIGHGGAPQVQHLHLILVEGNGGIQRAQLAVLALTVVEVTQILAEVAGQQLGVAGIHEVAAGVAQLFTQVDLIVGGLCDGQAVAVVTGGQAVGAVGDGVGEDVGERFARAERLKKNISGWSEDLFGGLTVEPTVFTGYETLNDTGVVVALSDEETLTDAIATDEEAKDGVLVVLDKTPFYAEMGGQVADNGLLTGPECSLRVLDVKKTPKGYYVHTCVLESGIVKVGDHLNAQVDKEYRMSVCRNHTATHLLQAALREVLGDHVHQAGSYQDAEITHFDFTHFSAVTPEELARVQKIVNDKIYESMNVTVKEMPIEEAKKLGAMALFGEKYGKVVRVVDIEGWSTEFCGGTHVKNTAQIGCFKIVSESSVAAGIRRIEAVTGRNLLVRANLQEAMLHTVANTLKANNITSLPIRAEAVMAENKAMSRELEEIKAKVAASKVSSLFDNAEEVGGVKIASAYFTGTTGETLRGMCDSIRDKAVNPVVAVLVGKAEDKVTMAVTVNKLAQEKGLKAGVLVKEISAIAGGKGGGKPDFAMAGLKDETKIDEALAAVKGIVEKQLG